MKGLVVDYHTTATRDVCMIMREMGHVIDSWNLSGHNWLFNEKSPSVPILKDTSLSSFNIDIGKDFWNQCSRDLCDYDFFVTGHTPCLSLLFSETKKPVIVCITTRYEHPFTGNSEKWKRFNDYLIENHSRNRFHFVSNNYYDANYFFHYTGIMPIVIQSLCHYHEGMWKKSKEDLVLYSKLRVSGDNISDIKSQGNYTWNEWYSYSGVLCIPYQVSTMSLFEFSAAGMPVKYPTISETLELRNKFPNQVLSEISWRSVSSEYSNDQYKFIKTYGLLPSPNSLDHESVKRWLEFSDCYTPWMNNVIGNDSSLNYQIKKKYFIDSWKAILENVAKESAIC